MPEEMNHSDMLAQLAQSVLDGNGQKVSELTGRAIEARVPAKQILDDGLLDGMATVGERFKAHEIFLPDVLLAAKAMYVGMDLLKPLLITEDVPSLGRVVIGSIHGDLHDIGKNLVGIMLKGAGFEIIDLGNDVPPDRFVDEAHAHDAGVIGMSALLTTTMQGMKTVVDLVRQRGLDGRIRTIIGGAPVTSDFARQIGADAYGFDAANAVDRVKQLMCGR
ncbi:MAG: corrinoid protein [Planctomycetota bacterium]|jgi:5-methyltetrahydrofolate--homocysteine methyltransferase